MENRLKRYRVTLLIPQERTIEARSAQDAHNEVSKILSNARVEENVPQPILHSIIPEDEERRVIDFGPSPAA
jgi:hypothetical protein